NGNTGPSPRVRGLRFGGGGLGFGVRTIPACAGLTVEARCAVLATPDHPRVCGAYWWTLLGLINFPGPSPRVRGLPERTRAGFRSDGTIPACAGLTLGDLRVRRALSISYPCLGRHALYRSGVLVRVVGRWAVPSRCSVLRPLQAFRRGDRVQVAVVELAVGLGVRARVDRGLVARKRRCQGQIDGAGGEEGRAEGR